MPLIFLVKTAFGLQKVDSTNVVYIQSETNVCIIYMDANIELSCCENMNLFKHSGCLEFITLGRNMIINIRKIKSIITGNNTIALNDGTIISLTKNHLKIVIRNIKRIANEPSFQ